MQQLEKLAETQIDCYSRQILLPQVGGAGMRKCLRQNHISLRTVS